MYCTKCGKDLIKGKCPVCDMAVTQDSKQVNLDQQKTKKISKKEKKLKEKKSKEKEPMTKRKKKILFISLAAALLFAALASFLVVYFVNDAKYKDATALLNDEEPKAASIIFEEIKWFKDSEEGLQECNMLMDYWEAEAAMNDNKFGKAIPLFAALGDYKDSETLTQFCQDNFDYETAGALFDSGDYAQSKAIYLSLEDFEDSKSNADACQVRLDYAEALDLYQREENLAAKLIFETIPEYEDSEKMVSICEARLTYADAVLKMGEGDHETALELLDSITDKIDLTDFSLIMAYREFRDVRLECFEYVSYNQGKAFLEQELFYSAYKAFGDAGSLNDAADLRESCVLPIESKELYVNPEYESNRVPITFYAPKESGRSVFVKIYSEDGDLVSTVLIKANSKRRIKLPRGVYTFNVGTGIDWFGEKEAFGDNAYYRTLVMDKDGGTTWKLRSNYIYTIKFEVKSGNSLPGIELTLGDF